jgi:cation transport ATPase
MEYYLHHVPGRLRVKIPNLKHRPGIEQDIQELLDMHGVTEVRIKNLTGSVIVQYDPDCIRHEQLLKALTDSGYYDHAKAITIDDQMRKASSKTSEKVGKVLFGWGVSKALEVSGLPLLAALI